MAYELYAHWFLASDHFCSGWIIPNFKNSYLIFQSLLHPMYIIHHPLWQQHYVCIQLTHKQLPGLYISKSDKHTNAKTHTHRDIKDIITHNSRRSHHEDQGYCLSNYLSPCSACWALNPSFDPNKRTSFFNPKRRHCDF